MEDNVKLAFLISDKNNNIAILSGQYDEEDNWDLVVSTLDGQYVFKNKRIEHIMCIYDSNKQKYTYIVDNKGQFKAMLIDAETKVELSEYCELKSLFDKLMDSADNVKVSIRNGCSRLDCSLFCKDITIYESIYPLMVGTHNTLNIIM